MSEQPSAGELDRAIAGLRQDNRDDHERLRSSLGHKVDRDVYQSDQRRIEDRYNQLREDMRQMAADHEAERKDFADWREKRDQARKWIIGGLILPVGGILVEIIDLLKTGSGH